MRETFYEILKDCFYRQLVTRREKLDWTQTRMAKGLLMDARSYIELDHGNSCGSSLTLMLFLIYYCEDPLAFLEEVQSALEDAGILGLI